jgi:hypothetical protein
MRLAAAVYPSEPPDLPDEPHDPEGASDVDLWVLSHQ